MPHSKLFGRTTGKLLLAAAAAISIGVAGCKQASVPAPDDAALSGALQSRLSGDAALASEPIQTSVQNGVATLNGNVSSQAARSLAANDAAQVSGIRTVVNNLTIQTAAATPPPVALPTPEVVAPPAAKVKSLPKRTEAKLPKSRPGPAPTAQQAQMDQPAPVVRTPPPPTAPVPPPPPAFRNVEVPSGTTLPVRITQTLDSATTQQGDTFSGTVANDVIVDGLVAIPHGTPVSGRVSAVQEAAHFKGNSLLTVELTSISRQGQSIPVTSEPFSKEGNGRGKNTATKVGGGAAVGAILGGIFGGGKGAAIGAASGGGLGAGANAITRGQQVQIPSESLIRFRTSNSVSVRASTSDRRAPDNVPEDNGQRRPIGPSNQ